MTLGTLALNVTSWTLWPTTAQHIHYHDRQTLQHLRNPKTQCRQHVPIRPQAWAYGVPPFNLHYPAPSWQRHKTSSNMGSSPSSHKIVQVLPHASVCSPQRPKGL